MKVVYIILFFIDLMALVVLYFLFLKIMDGKRVEITLTETIIGIFISLLLLVFFLFKYLNLCSGTSKNDLF